jgi:hypothetical protein
VRIQEKPNCDGPPSRQSRHCQARSPLHRTGCPPKSCRDGGVERAVLRGGQDFRWIEFRRNRRKDSPRLGRGRRDWPLGSRCCGSACGRGAYWKAWMPAARCWWSAGPWKAARARCCTCAPAPCWIPAEGANRQSKRGRADHNGLVTLLRELRIVGFVGCLVPAYWRVVAF